MTCNLFAIVAQTICLLSSYLINQSIFRLGCTQRADQAKPTQKVFKSLLHRRNSNFSGEGNDLFC